MTIMTMELEVGVAEAKATLAALLDVVERGGRVVVTRRGTPVAVLAPLDQVRPAPTDWPGFAAFAGALEDWPDFAEVMDEIVRSRADETGRPLPDLT